MTWLELSFQTTTQIAQCLEPVLELEGALAVTLQDAGDQPIYEPTPGSEPLWDNMLVTGLFEEQHDIKKTIAQILNLFPGIKYQLKNIKDQEWERAWMQDFLPMQFGNRLWIIPSYQKEQHSPHQVILDPGLAFGTGKHPTTALCLRWLDKHIEGGEIVIDYGCGSGILGIAALKLGAKKVFAIDNDHQAILATEENARHNGLTQDDIATFYPQELSGKQQADIIIANILANPLIELAQTFYQHAKHEGAIVLSGILLEQSNLIQEAYSPWFEINEVELQDEWVRISGIKKTVATRKS